MTKVILIRHAQASAGWGDSLDPDLSAEGLRQADAMAEDIAGRGPLPLVSSPLLRARSTAAALERRWGVVARVEPRVGEVPSPPGVGLADRGPWLAGVMRRTWDDPEVGPELLGWRDSLIGAVASLAEDTVVTTHLVAINALLGEAVGDRRVTCFRPGYCSRTILEAGADGLRLVEKGEEGLTVVR